MCRLEENLDADKIIGMFTPRTKRVVELAAYEARMRQLDVIEPEHLLLGIIREGDSVAMRILKANGIDPRTLYNSCCPDAAEPAGRTERQTTMASRRRVRRRRVTGSRDRRDQPQSAGPRR